MINQNPNGKVTLSKKVFKDIAYNASTKVKDIFPVKNDNSFVDVEVKDDDLSLELAIKIQTGVDVVKVCSKLQSAVHEAIEGMTGIDCKNIRINIQGFKTEKAKQIRNDLFFYCISLKEKAINIAFN